MNKSTRPKTVRFYPVLPRSPKPKKNRPLRAPAYTASVPLRYTKVIHANLLSKPSGLFEPDKINVRSTIELGASTRSKTYNPGWKVSVAKHANATYPYFRSIATAKTSMYSCRSENSTYLSTGYGVLCRAPIITAKSYTPLIDEAIGKLRNKLNGHVGRAELAAPIAESREIHRMLRQINSLAIDTVKALMAIKKTKGKSALKHASNIWLGLGFGVNPLLKDIEQAAKSIQDYNSRMDNYVRVVGTAGMDWTTSEKVIPDQFSEQIATGLRVGYTNSCNHKQGVQIIAGINIRTMSTASYSMGDHLGLKLSSLPSVLWELTPFSWAVDYFTTVSPWIDDMFYTLPGTTVYVSQSAKYQSENTCDPITWSQAGYAGSISGGRSVTKYLSFNRTTLSQLPSRSLAVKSSDDIAKHGLTKLLNLAAVLAQKRGPNL